MVQNLPRGVPQFLLPSRSCPSDRSRDLVNLDIQRSRLSEFVEIMVIDPSLLQGALNLISNR